MEAAKSMNESNHFATLHSAEQHFREAIKLEPKYIDPYFNLACVLEEREDHKALGGAAAYRARNYDEPEKLYRTCISLKPPFLPIAEKRLTALLAKKPRSLSQKISESAKFASSSIRGGLAPASRMRKVEEEVQPEPEPEPEPEDIFTVTVPSGKTGLELYDWPGRDGARVASASAPELWAVKGRGQYRNGAGKKYHGDVLMAIDDGDEVKDVSFCSARIIGIILGAKAGDEIKLTFCGVTPPSMPAEMIAFRRGDPAKAELV